LTGSTFFAKVNKALDEIRAEETRRMKLEGRYFRGGKLISSRVAEGLNNKAKVTMRKSYGFPYLPSARTGTLSLTWQAARARIYPRFLLANLILMGELIKLCQDATADSLQTNLTITIHPHNYPEVPLRR
jgi:hypothetical protein